MIKLPGLGLALVLNYAFLLAPVSYSAEPKSFQDCPNCPKMVVIPTGRFYMGTPDSVTQFEGVKAKRAKRERPVHPVWVKLRFAIGKYEITRTQYAAFIQDNGYTAPGGCKYWTGEKFEIADDKDWKDPGYPQGDNHPAVCISWNDAKAYTKWLSLKTGKAYRLPSEAEWEYAARAGSGTARFWGNNSAKACKFANVFDKTGAASGEFLTMTPHRCDDGYKQTSPVGSYMANAFGLHDTAGNAWEWNEDCWHKSYSGAPIDNRAWTASGRCNQRIVRGGSWISIARYVRSGNRSKINKDSRIYRNGFRVALTLGR